MAQGLTGARSVVLVIILATLGYPSDGALQCVGSACTSIDLCNESRRAASAYTLRCPGGGFWRCTDGGGGTDLQCPYSPLQSFSLTVHCEGLAIGPPSTVDWYCGASKQSTTCYNWQYACLDARPAANAALTCTGVACKGKDLCNAGRQAVAPYKLTCPGGGSWKCGDVATQQAKECAAPNQMQLTVHCEGLAIGPPSTVDYTCGSQGPVSTVCYNWKYFCLDRPATVSGGASTAPDDNAAYQRCLNGCKEDFLCIVVPLDFAYDFTHVYLPKLSQDGYSSEHKSSLHSDISNASRPFGSRSYKRSLLELDSETVALSWHRRAATMSPIREASRPRTPNPSPLLLSVAYSCLFLNPLACHAAPRTLLQADASANASDVSGLLLGGTLVPDQLLHGVVVILTPDGSLGTGVLIKPAFVLTAAHVVGIQVGPGIWGPNPAITTDGTKICQSTTGTDWYGNGQNCVRAKTFSFNTGGGDAALIGLDQNSLILDGSWGSSQTYPTPHKGTNGFLFTLGNSNPSANQQVTLYGAGPGSLDIGAEPGLVRSGIFNTVGTCSAVRCQYTTTQPCQQKNSAGGDSGGPVFDSNNVLVGIHNAGKCHNNVSGPTLSSYLPVAAVLDWIKATANTNGCANPATRMIGATLIGQRVLSGIQDTLQIYQCYLGTPGQIYISMNSSQSFFKKEAVLISDSCGSETNICDITIQAGADNVNQPQVCVPGQPSSPTGTPLSPTAVGSSFAFDVYKDGSLISQHTGADSALDSVCVEDSVPGAVEFQSSNFVGGGILINWLGVGCASCPGSPSTPTGPPNPQPGGDVLSGYGK